MCNIENCNSPILAKGLCNMHYIRKRNNIDMHKQNKERRDSICTIEGCQNKHEALGLCKSHYRKEKTKNNPGYKIKRQLLIDQGFKNCTKCKVIKNLSEFYFNKSRNDYYGICKNCDKENQKRLRKERSDIYRHRDREKRIKKEYNISQEHYLELQKKQDKKCAICKKVISKLNIDHCHETGEIRGLLCHHCNVGLGHFKDNIEYLENAIEYLKNGKF